MYLGPGTFVFFLDAGWELCVLVEIAGRLPVGRRREILDYWRNRAPTLYTAGRS